jgi:hypothetical protein
MRTSPECNSKAHDKGCHVLDEDAQPLTDSLLVCCCVIIQAAQEGTCSTSATHHVQAQGPMGKAGC